MSTDAARIAEEARGLALPDGVEVWPPAPGWWLLAGLVVAGIGLRIAFLVRKLAGRRAALRELDRIETAHRQTGDGAALAAAVSALLRRLALTRAPRTEVAGLSGEAWLDWLDRHGGGGDFTRGAGRAVAEAPYASGQPVDAGALLAAARRWIRANTP